jgi:hypothetical protein
VVSIAWGCNDGRKIARVSNQENKGGLMDALAQRPDCCESIIHQADSAVEFQ